MKRIGTIAAKLIANPIELVAAANEKRGTEFEGGRSSTGSANERPMRSSRGQARAFVNGKKAGAGEAPASADREVLHGTGEEIATGHACGTHMRPALRLVIGNRDMPSVKRRPMREGTAFPPLGRPMLLVIEGGLHQRMTPRCST